ncbi:MAG: hypothetical protein JNM76_11605 [Betaproteobacteria bacterium]|nr:hypothetical protein [Betaproteobacteria bacterium]
MPILKSGVEQTVNNADRLALEEVLESLGGHLADERLVLRYPKQVKAEAELSLQRGTKVHLRVANVTFQLFEKLDIRDLYEDAEFWSRALVGWDLFLGIDFEPVAYSPELVRELAEHDHFRLGLLPRYLDLWLAAKIEEPPKT